MESKEEAAKMYAEIVTITVILGCIPCIAHSWRVRGRWTTAAFFIGGFVFGIVRENIVALLPGMYSYPEHPLYIGAAPLMMGFGWSASFYACWAISERILEGFAPRWKDSRWVVPLVAGIATALLAIPVEVAAGAGQTGWWVWPSSAIAVLWEMPAIVPFGWGGAAFLFILFLREITKRVGAQDRAALYFILSTLIVIALHLVYVLLVRAVIVQLLG
jgi:hypothetical protein